MQYCFAKKIVTSALVISLLPLLQACTSTPAAIGVADAFETSGIVSVQPYNRTIFSNSNF